MKTIHIALLMFVGLFVACKSSYISIEVLKPAQITVPQEIKTIALLNRSLPSKNERGRNVLEGIITGEDIFADRKASEECINGVFNGLSNSPRFKAVVPGGLDFRGTGTRQFPEPLDWQIVDNICKQNNVEALVCLEVFDSNNRKSMSERKVTKKQNDKEITYTEYTARLEVNVESGWKIYFPSKRIILDQNVFNDSKYWNNSSDAGKRAEDGLIPMDRAISETGFYAGRQYARRISPLWIRVSRDYYRKGNDDFERAKRRAEVNDWKGAAELWSKYTESRDVKIAGYATYNMALASEMDGDLEKAISWARKSYVDYKNKHARNYLNILEQRSYDQRRLDEQMNGVQ